MKNFIIISFVFVMLLSMSAFASETRVMTMGDNNNILLDDANIWMYPSRILDHTNIGVAEIGQFDSDFNQIGINWKLDDNSALGTYFSTESSWDRINLFYGKDLNGNRFGVHLDLKHWSEKSENDTTFTGGLNSEAGESEYDITVGLTEANGQWDVSLHFGTGSFTDIDTDGNDITEPDGINRIGVYGRYFKTRNPNYTTIYHAAIMTDKFAWKNSTTNNVTYEKELSLDVGCGINFTPSSHVLAVFDFGLIYTKITDEFTGISDTETKTFTFPYFKMGFDGEVFKWLDVRVGATSYWHNEKEEFESQSFTQKYAENMTYFGLGFNFGHAHIDLEANPRLFVEGPDFISSASEDLGASMSFTYDF